MLTAVGLFAVSDNLAFYGETLAKRECGRYLPTAARDMYAWINMQKLTACCYWPPNEDLSYLSATYTTLQPYYGHRFNTPQVQRHRRNWTTGT